MSTAGVRTSLAQKARGGFRVYPTGTIAFYGPDDRRATKIAVGVKAPTERLHLTGGDTLAPVP